MILANTRRWRCFRYGVALGWLAAAALFSGPACGQDAPTQPAASPSDADDPDIEDIRVLRAGQVGPGPGLEPQRPVGEVAAQEPRPSESARPMALAALPLATETDGGAMWEVPPLPWRGQLALTAGRSKPVEGDSSTVTAQIFSADANSYVWQPWFLRVNGNTYISRNQDRTSSSRSDSAAWGFGLGGNLLPATRYPFSFSGNLSRNSLEGRSAASAGSHGDTQTATLSLYQAYAPIDQAYSTNWSYNMLKAESTTSTDNEVPVPMSSTSHNLVGNLLIPVRSENPQSLTFNTNLNSTRNDQAGASTFLGTVAGAHSIYLEDYVMTLASDAQVNRTEITAPLEQTRSSFAQVGTHMDWIPSDDYPLNIGGAARYYGSRAGTGGNESEVTNLNLSASARYPLDKYWSFAGQFAGALATNESVSGEESRQFYQLNASANWAGEGVRSTWGDWNHSLNYGSSSTVAYSYSDSSNGEADRSTIATVGASLGQYLMRNFAVDREKPIRLSLAESYAVNGSGRGEPLSHSLSHSANVGWETEKSDDVKITFQGTAEDGRTYGLTHQVYQRVVGATGADVVLGHFSTFGSRANVGFSRQQGTGSARWFGSAAAGVNYSHHRFADVSGLLYQARYDVNLRERLVTSPTGDLSGDGVDLQHVASQSWSWRLGRLGWKLDHSMSKIGNGGISQSVFLSVTRDFSGVL